MSVSKCPHCKGISFQVVQKEPSGSRYKQNFTQCSGCGAPFGVTDYYNLGALLKTQEKTLAGFDDRLSSMEHSLRQIVQALQR